MPRMIYRFTYIVAFVLITFATPYAEEDKPKGMPPAQVVLSDINTGLIAPQSEFIGTVYYQEVSEVASEVSGSVESVLFDEGQRMKKDDILVKLSSDLLEKKLQSTRASHEQVLANLENAHINLDRIENLRKEELVSETRYDEQRFLVRALESRAASLKAEVELLEVEQGKKAVKVPFEGIVIEKHIDRGEWLSEGATVATIAKDDVVDVYVDVPEEVIKSTKKAMNVKVVAGGHEINGQVFAIIPSGDVATRTFPVKVRITNSMSLIEGMEARVTLPSGEKENTLVVPRDAVITMFGTAVIFTVIENKAKMIPVQVVGYEGLIAGIQGQGLTEGMKVVVKGNERLRDGQEVIIQ